MLESNLNPLSSSLCLLSLSRENSGGDNRARTDDPLLAKQVLSQLSYTPIPLPREVVVGLDGLEPSTSRLSVVRSSQLSYRPISRVPSKLNNVKSIRSRMA